MPYRKPTPLSAEHSTETFESGELEIDDWLKDWALYNQRKNFTRTFVITDATGEVVAYHAMCTASIQRNEQPRAMREHGQPRQIPVALLARLGVSKTHQGQGLGEAILRNALLCAISAADQVAFRGVIVHALNEEVAAFCRRYGFVDLPGQERTLIVATETILDGIQD